MTHSFSPLPEIQRFEATSGNIITLMSDGVRWQVVCWKPDGTHVWTETETCPEFPFTEEDAREEFARWSV